MQKVILLTGASSRLGSAIAEKLSEKHLIYAGSRNSNMLRFSSNNIKPITLDITDSESCKIAVKEILRQSRRIDVVINVAGVTPVKVLQETEDDEILSLFNINTLGAFRLSKVCLPSLIKSQGKIINITSLNGQVALPHYGAYSASKHALDAIGVIMHHEWGQLGVQVTNLAPGAIKNEKLDTNSTRKKSARQRFPLLKILLPMLTVEDVALKISQLVDTQHPPSRVTMGIDAFITVNLYRLLPTRLWDRLLTYISFTK